jgi:4-hydroxy-2-oxoglutarate aldolase
MSDDFAGVFAPVVTPFLSDELRLDWLKQNLQQLARTGLKGYLALGSNGENRSLSEEEQLQVLEVFAEEKADRVVMVGIAAESTKLAVGKARRAAEMGFPYASLLTPSYFSRQMNDQVFKAYYTRVAESSPIPILLYNAPGFAGGISLSAGCVLALAEHPNIAGIKDSTPAGPGGLLAQLGDRSDFAVLAGSANFFYPSLVLGAVGGVLSLANSLPSLCCRLYRLYTEGSYDEALELHRTILRINRATSGRFGVAGVKAAVDLAGMMGGEPRHPLRPLTESERDSIRSVIEELEVEVG